MSPRVAVVGGGLAGIAAALRCADAGLGVTLFESARRLGGLTHSFRRDGLWVDNGQHVFLRCCTAYQVLLRRLGMADAVRLQPRLDIPIAEPGEPRVARLTRAGLPAPLHLIPGLARYRLLSVADRARCVWAAWALGALDPSSAAVDRVSFGDWLRAQGQSPRSIEALWDVVGIATLNARADQASLALAATVFQRGLLSTSGAGDLGWSLLPLGQLHGQAARAALGAAGAEVRLAAAVRAVLPGGHGWRVRTERGEERFDAVVVATPPATAEQLLPAGSLELSPGWSHRLGSTPIINVHVVLDRVVLDRPVLAGVGTEVQWVFDRTGPSGLADRPGNRCQYLAVSVSAADELVGLSTSVLRSRLLPALAALVPGLAKASVRDFFVTRERHATFRQAPGSGAHRPPTHTGHDGLVLGGAWTNTGWPATMEGAVRSGNAAAVAVRRRLLSPSLTHSEGVTR